VNECVCHGIPDSRQLQEGDIVNIDVTVYLDVSKFTDQLSTVLKVLIVICWKRALDKPEAIGTPTTCVCLLLPSGLTEHSKPLLAATGIPW
jgi:methionine aminopeptidase